MSQIQYNPLDQEEGERNTSFDLDGGALRFNAPIPISRAPTSPRDLAYFSAFMFIFIGCSVAGFIHHSGFLQDSFVLYQKAGGWKSMLMVATLFGTVIGFFLMFAMFYAPLRENIIKYAVSFSVIAQLLLSVTVYFGIGAQCWPLSVIIAVGALCDFTRYKTARELQSFTETTIDLAVKILSEYDTSLIACLVALSVVQTGVLLWLGVIFVGLLTEVHAALAAVSILILSFTAYWTVQIFSAIVSTIGGACVLWFFLKDGSERLDAHGRVALYSQTALSTSLGSLCKAALLVPPSQVFLSANHWSKQSPSSHAQDTTFMVVRALFGPIAQRLRRNSRLVYTQIGVYGQTFNKAALEADVDDSIHILLDSTVNTVMKSVACGATIVVLACFAAAGHDDPSLPLFLSVSFFLVFAGANILLCALRASVDTLSMAFAANPTLFARMSPVVFHRYLRSRESTTET